MLQLRPYQLDCLNAIKKAYQEGHRRLLVSLPTGSGKTIIFSQLISDLKQRTLVIAHTTELLEQSKNKIEMMTGVDVGIVDQGHKEFDSPVVVSSIQSAMIPANLQKLSAQHFTLCIYDESHRAASDGARGVLNSLLFGEGTKKLLLGVTATPFRHDTSKGLAEVFDKVVYEVDVEELIEEGYLVRPIGYMIANDLDLAHVPTVDGDFRQASLANVMDTSDMVEAVVDSHQKKAAERKTICFGVSVEHSKHLAECFQRHGVKAALIHGDMDHKERRKYLEEYKDGDLQVLCNAQVLTEGIDLPETSCIIMSPTRSRLKFQQACGRGLRPAPWANKKDCVILNFGDIDHKICSIAILLKDPELASEKTSTEKESVMGEIPAALNPRLKTAIASFDPLGKSFTWQHVDGEYVMKGNNNILLQVKPQNSNQWCAICIEGQEQKILAHGLSFEYAFGAAEDYAKEHKNLFVIQDLNAPWRKLPITDKQKKIFKKHRFGKGIDQLTRGQAAMLISSGALRNGK